MLHRKRIMWKSRFQCWADWPALQGPWQTSPYNASGLPNPSFHHSKTMQLIVCKKCMLNNVSLNRNTHKISLKIDPLREMWSFSLTWPGSPVSQTPGLVFLWSNGSALGDSVLRPSPRKKMGSHPWSSIYALMNTYSHIYPALFIKKCEQP